MYAMYVCNVCMYFQCMYNFSYRGDVHENQPGVPEMQGAQAEQLYQSVGGAYGDRVGLHSQHLDLLGDLHVLGEQLGDLAVYVLVCR